MNQNYNETDEVEIDLLDLFYEILRHWKAIVASTILVASIAFSVSKLLIVPTYESTSELYVLTKSTSITSLSDLQTGTSLTNDYIVVVAGRPVLEQVISNLGLEEDYSMLSDKVDINNPSNSRILEITVTDANPSRAKLIADEIASVASAYISDKMDQDPPSIIQRGYADEEPVAPATMKNTIIGAMLGFLLAVAIVVLSYMLNDTIITPEDVETKLGLTVLGSIPLEEEMEYDGKRKEK